MEPLTIAVGLYDHYESHQEVKHYYGLLAIYALARAADAGADEALFDRCEKILRRFPDDIEHPPYNFPSYTIGGIPLAFLVSTGRMADRREILREYADEMMSAPRDPNGIVTMPRQPDANLIWIDAAMATTPFLMYAGAALEAPEYLEEAYRQATLMYDEFLDSANGLLHQCKNFVGPGKYSQDHWSRGNGWGYLALAELVRNLPTDSPLYPDARRRFVALSAALIPHQSESGLWRQEIPLTSSYEESSGTGLILYGIGVGLRHGLLDEQEYLPVFRKGITGLVERAVNPDFSTEHSCPGCLCPGEGSEKGTVDAYVNLRIPYRDEPHSFGPIMLALAEAHLHGVRDLQPAGTEDH